MNEPWREEPVHERWKSEAGFDCVVNRTDDLGILCGYVRVEKDHPLYQVSYPDGPATIFDVHGGVTYSEANVPGEAEVPGEWWFGFDCGHAYDLVPAFLDLFSPQLTRTLVYRDFQYVKDECEHLAFQLDGTIWSGKAEA